MMTATTAIGTAIATATIVSIADTTSKNIIKTLF